MTVFVIKSLQKGIWYYYRGVERREWDVDLYVAHKFSEYKDAEYFLKTAFREKHWGGFYQIEKNFVNS